MQGGILMRIIFLIAVLGLTSLGFSYEDKPLSMKIEVDLEWPKNVDKKLDEICQKIEILGDLQDIIMHILIEQIEIDKELYGQKE